MTPPRSSSSSALLLIASLLSTACDKGSEPAADKAPTDAKAPADTNTADPKPTADANTTADANPTTDAKPAAKKPAQPNTFKPPTKAEIAAQKQSLQAHLDAGRKAVKAKDYETGIAELEKAAKINPFHAKTLGELGWAYFNAGKLDQAQDRLERGLHYADNDGTRGAILYNLGRVAEAKNDKTLAIELYTRSLAVRPNDTVSQRLTSLGGAAPSPGAVPVLGTHSQCRFSNKGAAPGHLCWAELAELGHDVHDPSSESSYRCEYGSTVLDNPTGMIDASGEVTAYDLELDGGKVKVAIYSVFDEEMMYESFTLAIVIDGVLHTAPLAGASHPGVGYADENVEGLTVRSEDLVPGGRPELVIEWRVIGHDLDPGVEMEELWSTDYLAVVSVDGSAPTWLLSLARTSERSSGPMTSWADDDTPSEAPAGSTETVRKAVDVSWSGGQVTVVANGEASAPIGSFAFASYPQRCPAEL